MSGVALGGVEPRRVVRDLVMLTKPRIISLLLVTTVAPMFVAGSPGWQLVLVVVAGGYLMAGGANAVDMYLDRDIFGAYGPVWTAHAWRVYKYSLLYLALLFVAMVADRTLVG